MPIDQPVTDREVIEAAKSAILRHWVPGRGDVAAAVSCRHCAAEGCHHLDWAWRVLEEMGIKFDPEEPPPEPPA